MNIKYLVCYISLFYVIFTQTFGFYVALRLRLLYRFLCKDINIALLKCEFLPHEFPTWDC